MPSELLGAAADYIPTLIHRSSITFLAIGVVGLSVFFFRRRDQIKQTPIVCASLLVLAIGCSIVVGLLAWNDTQQRERMAWIQAHRELDRLVDSLYRPTPFADDADRLNLLLDKYSGLSIDHPGEEVAESC